MNVSDVIEKNNKITKILAENLIEKLNTDFCFNQREFYAKSFLLSSLYLIDKNRYESIINKLKNSIRDEKKSKVYHYEFNRYALSHVYGEQQIDKLLGSRLYTWGRAANWSILRVLTEVKKNYFFQLLSILEIIRIKFFFKKNNYIEDLKNFYSSQYNFFSLALLHELKIIRPYYFDNSWLKRSVIDSLHQVSSYGHTNFLGRGACQSFGYSSLIYLFSFYKDENNYIDNALFSLLDILHNELENTNELPLVLHKANNQKNAFGINTDLNKKEFLGWYSYNNALDYQSFCLFMLVKTNFNLKKNRNDIQINHRKGFKRITSNIYVFNNTNFHIYCGFQKKRNNELCLFNPIVIYKNKIVMPPIGGEQSSDSLNNNSDFGLPKFYINKKPVEISSLKHIRVIKENEIEITIYSNKVCCVKRKVLIKNDEIAIIDKIKNISNSSLIIDGHRISINKDYLDNITCKNEKTISKIIKKKSIKEIYSTYNECFIKELKIELEASQDITLNSTIKF